MTVLVCGSRDWADEEAIRRELGKLRMDTVIIHGACRGADQLAGKVAVEYFLQVLPFPADWRTHGRAAGPIRNRQMLEEGKPDLVLCFHEDLEHSRGSGDMVRQARKAGVEVRLIREAAAREGIE